MPIPLPAHAHQRQHLAAIVSAATEAIAPEKLAADQLTIESPGELLLFNNQPLTQTGRYPLDLSLVDQIVVVGGGKAAAGLAVGIERLLGKERLKHHGLRGLISVPAGCHVPLQQIEVRETRPTGTNLPTTGVVNATSDMLNLLSELGPNDLAIALVTGGGSALLEVPAHGISLEELRDLTQRISTQGADIKSLNLIRQFMSRVKGGGLATTTTAGRLLTLVISDVIGNPLELIASGPCLPTTKKPAAITAMLEGYTLPTNILEAIHNLPLAETNESFSKPTPDGSWITPKGCQVDHLLLGSNATAISAAATAAVRCGYEVVATATDRSSDTAEQVGRRLADRGLELLATARQLGRSLAMIEGGEATVQVPTDHGSGGRNQHTALAAAVHCSHRGWPDGLLLASFGTDGEDGPTIAAGGLLDAATARSLFQDIEQLSIALKRCDAHAILKSCNGLIKTGPTGANVADLRILLAHPEPEVDRTN